MSLEERMAIIADTIAAQMRQADPDLVAIEALINRLMTFYCPAARNMDPRSASKNDPSIA